MRKAFLPPYFSILHYNKTRCFLQEKTYFGGSCAAEKNNENLYKNKNSKAVSFNSAKAEETPKKTQKNRRENIIAQLKPYEKELKSLCKDTSYIPYNESEKFKRENPSYARNSLLWKLTYYCTFYTHHNILVTYSPKNQE